MKPSGITTSLAAAFALVALAPPPASGQRVLTGIILDSASRRPLADVTIAQGSAWTRSGSDGEFRLALSSATDDIVVHRLGYSARRVRIDTTAGRTRLVVLLAQHVAALPGLTVEDVAIAPMAMTVTPATIRQLPPLVEPDVFRGVAFLPGVLQANDLRGRLNLAGGRSDETGVRLNGHPLQNPFHFSELMGSFPVAAIERADVLIHHLGPEYADRLSGVVDLTTRLPRGQTNTEATASLLSSSLTTSVPRLPLGISLLASGRITYWDKVAPTLFSDVKLRDVPLYGFFDGLLVGTRSWDNGTRIELTGFGTRDQVDFLERRSQAGSSPYAWGEYLMGATLSGERGASRWRARLSFDRGRAGVTNGTDGLVTTTLDSRSDRLSATVVLEQSRSWGTVTGGFTLDQLWMRHAWQGLSAEFNSFFGPDTYDGTLGRRYTTLFVGATTTPATRWQAGVDARLWLDQGKTALAPSAWLSRKLTGQIQLVGALERRLQVETEPGEPRVGFGRAPSFPLDTPRVADVAALSLMHTGAGGDTPSQVQLQVFVKQYRNRVRLVEPDTIARQALPDSVLWAGFPAFERGTGHSAGFLLSGRLRVWRLLLQGHYTYQRAHETFGIQSYASNWDAPHSAAGLASLWLPNKWTLNMSAQARSGLPLTGVVYRVLEPAPDGSVGQRYVMGERNGLRLPPYLRIDYGVRHSWGTRREWTVSFQVQNALFRWNPTGVKWAEYFCNQDQTCQGVVANQKPYETYSLPIVPSLGLEVRW